MAAPMASDNSGLRRLFEKPLPENPTLLEALSAWNRNTHPNKPIDPSSFTEIFGELHFQEKQPERAAAPPAPARASWLDIAAAAEAEKSKDDSSLDALLRPKPAASTVATVKRSASFCLKKSSASLLLCTEGLGSESTVDADDMFKDGDAEAEAAALKGTETGGGDGDAAAAGDAEAIEATKGEEERQPKTFPPPIRSIGRGGGKPRVCFRSFREDGRFVLLEVVIPGKDLLQATRECGRLRLQFANGAAAAAVAAGGVGVGEELVG